MNKVRSLEEILHRCAVLRSVANLQHRTLHESIGLSAHASGVKTAPMAKREQKYTEYTRIERVLDWTAMTEFL